MNDALGGAVQAVSWLAIALGTLSSLLVIFDLPRRRPQMMFVMNLVWPINTLWAGPIGIWMYWKLGRMAPRSADLTASAGQMDLAERPFWQKVVAGTLHCGSGCTLADLVGPFVFAAAPFAVLGSMVYGEWTLDFFLALLVGVSFQYMALSPMLGQKGLPIWWRALKVDFLSLSAWQVGMYGWMALVIFVWFGRIPPGHPQFWFMMQLAMTCGFLTAYPMNWFLIKVGVKTAM